MELFYVIACLLVLSVILFTAPSDNLVERYIEGLNRKLEIKADRRTYYSSKRK